MNYRGYQRILYKGYLCKECKEKLSEETEIFDALNKAEPDDGKSEDDEQRIASLFGKGSVVIICSFLGLAILSATIIYLQKMKKGNKGE